MIIYVQFYPIIFCLFFFFRMEADSKQNYPGSVAFFISVRLGWIWNNLAISNPEKTTASVMSHRINRFAGLIYYSSNGQFSGINWDME